ncbi:MAG: HTH domain-containing protein [Euryarchaeota archaeon]|nr:HTH domain-containing protein [Euryarchaeota archaeon]
MGFEITVSRNLPLTSIGDLDEAARIFLAQIGYLRSEGDGGTALRLFDCFLKRPDKAWTVEDIAVTVKASKPTVYRYIARLRDIDLVEEAPVETKKGRGRGYRVRYGSLAKAWNFVEANVEVAMENYRKSVEHIEALAERERRK